MTAAHDTVLDYAEFFSVTQGNSIRDGTNFLVNDEDSIRLYSGESVHNEDTGV